MKTNYFYSAIIAVALVYTLPANADTSGNSIAVVNIQEIMRDSSAAKDVRSQLEEKSKGFQADISKKQEQLQKEDQDLGKQRSVLSKSAFDEKARAFSKKATDAQKEAQSKKAMLDGAFEHALNDIQKAVTDIIGDMAKEKGFSVTMPTSQTLYYDPKMDITSEVLSKLNQKLPKLDVQFASEAPSSSSSDDSDSSDSKSKKKK